MSRLWDILSRRRPLVAPADPAGRPSLTFGFVVESELQGWTVTAYGSDGRRLGRPLKGLSEAAQLTLTGSIAQVTEETELRRLSDAWAQACRRATTNAEVLTAFADAAGRGGSAA